MIEVTSSLTCLITGIDSIDPSRKCLGVDLKTRKIGFVEGNGGAIGTMGGLIAATFTPPAGSTDFTRYLAGNFGIAKSAYAANGVGFTGLSPILPIWIAFRNVTYLFFVLVFVVIGFAIMFRVHIDPRTVMTIENQIPKIIVALILVTFSFAIAGFLIDIMYVLTYLAINVFNSIDIKGIQGTIASNPAFIDIQGRTVFEVANNIPFTNAQPSGILGVVTSSTNGVREIVSHLFAGDGTVLDALSKFPLVGGALGGFGNAVINILAFLIIGIAVLVALFRLWLELIKAYIFIILDIIIAPFWILAGLIPGANVSFASWLREIGGELLAFPATIVMFLLGKALIDGFSNSPGFFPPLIGNPGAPKTVGALLGLGMILLTPNVVNMIKGWLKAPKFDISAIAQAIGAGAGYPVNVGKGVGGILGGANEYEIQNVTGPEENQRLVYGKRTKFMSFLKKAGLG